MKKLFILLFFLFVPNVKAYNITDYKIDLTILENGNVNVVEMFKLSGEYNGFERSIKYRNNYEGYKGDALIVSDKKLYDGSGIIINEVRSIDYSDELPILEIIKTGDLFKKSDNATKGDYGVYKVEQFHDGQNIKIYNSSKMNKDFYINYTLKNMVITHEDISELMFPIFYEMNEIIDNFELTINFPNNNKILESWVHGNDSEFIKIDSKTLRINISNLNTNNYFDFRLIFDKLDTNKLSEVEAYETIIKLENNLNIDFNNNINKEYEQLKENAYSLVDNVEKTLNGTDYDIAYEAVNKLNDKDELKTQLLVRLMNVEPKIKRQEDIIKVTLTSILTIWAIGNFLILYNIYKKYNKKTFKYKCYKEIPNDYNPAIVGYLLHKKITNNDLVASILYLIDKGVIKVKKTRKDYILRKENIKNITNSEEFLLKLIFDEKKEISLMNFERKAKNYEEFLNLYSNWLNIATNEAEKKEFFIDVFSIKLTGIIYSIIGVIISLFLIGKNTYYSSFIILIISIISLIYYFKFYKRTLFGNIEYSKWIGLKKYIEKFYTFNIEDLPKDINKYITYSICLNCDYNLSRVVKIDDYVYDLYDSIIYTINTAYLTKKNMHTKYSSINKNKR